MYPAEASFKSMKREYSSNRQSLYALCLKKEETILFNCGSFLHKNCQGLLIINVGIDAPLVHYILKTEIKFRTKIEV
jgi:hypothetical protein